MLPNCLMHSHNYFFCAFYLLTIAVMYDFNSALMNQIVECSYG